MSSKNADGLTAGAHVEFNDLLRIESERRQEVKNGQTSTKPKPKRSSKKAVDGVVGPAAEDAAPEAGSEQP